MPGSSFVSGHLPTSSPGAWQPATCSGEGAPSTPACLQWLCSGAAPQLEACCTASAAQLKPKLCQEPSRAPCAVTASLMSLTVLVHKVVSNMKLMWHMTPAYLQGTRFGPSCVQVSRT
jgi:hypothetical protein